MPKGWSYKSVFDVSKVTYGFPFDSELFSTDSTLKPIIRIRDILSNTTDTFTSEDVDDKYFISENDVLVGMDGVFHMTIWHGKKSLQNQRVVRFTADASKNISPYQVFYSIIGPIKEAEGSVEGTTVAHLGDKDVKKMLVLVADDLTQEKTYKHFQAILDMVDSLKKECMLLESMKQLLLEKLAK